MKENGGKTGKSLVILKHVVHFKKTAQKVQDKNTPHPHYKVRCVSEVNFDFKMLIDQHFQKYFMFTYLICMCTCHHLHVVVRGHLKSHFSPSTKWVLETELRLSAWTAKYRYLLSHLASPLKHQLNR